MSEQRQSHAASVSDKIRGLLGEPPVPALKEHEAETRAATDANIAAITSATDPPAQSSTSHSSTTGGELA